MSIKDFLISCLFPKRCAVCDEIIDYNSDMCNNCVDELTPNKLIRSMYYAEGNKAYDCFSPFCYKGKIREIILRFKFHNYTKCVDFFAKEIAKMIYKFCDVKDIDYICFVPMTESGILERGYNQSEILAKTLGKTMDIDVKDVLVKVRETDVQHRLSAKDRKRNLFSAFSVREGIEVENKNFILCDDIVTTGSTLQECLRVLKESGANKVVCCTIATARDTE